MYMRLFFLALILAILGGTAVAADDSKGTQREALLERYASIFAARTVFDEQQVVMLEADTRSYFYEREAAGGQGKDKNLQRLHAKLLLYLNFFPNQYQGTWTAVVRLELLSPDARCCTKGQSSSSSDNYRCVAALLRFDERCSHCPSVASGAYVSGALSVFALELLYSCQGKLSTTAEQ